MKLFKAKPRVLRFTLFCVLLCVAFFAAFEYSKPKANDVKVLVSTPQLQSVDIGSYDNLEDGQRATIQELSRQLKHHPKTREFEVHLKNPETDKEFTLFYSNYRHLIDFSFTLRRLSHWTVTTKFPFINHQIIFETNDRIHIALELSPSQLHYDEADKRWRSNSK